MSCKYCYYPYQENQTRGGFLLPLVGGILIGGIAAPFFMKNNNQYQGPYIQPNYNNYYPYNYPTYQQGSYSYPYNNNGFYHY